MFNLFKKAPVLTETEIQSQRKKDNVFNEVKTWKAGREMSKNDMKEYIQALCNYRSWIKASYIEMSLIQYERFVLVEIETSKLPISDDFWPFKKEFHEAAKVKIKTYKALFLKSGWSPPIIFDQYNKKIIDGNHRAKALKELGCKKILVFIGIPYLSWNPEKSMKENVSRNVIR
ncbi:ParB-like nuclease family protein [Algoriphagus ratkowskyi]|uniref:ParB-like nuclease family protein n=1 Tax=Algoriphagus ratkowskyi TaxID=57028 RepID=A0A2W7SBG1_9BACT|nr:ParB N-terminal domain-containing protein [Algoriphagus ratkowskyi]PZX60205.1 ParB-like nuclease family protein [Algoriphagus ratkowskyi]TXD78031.1 hypothetical protein ESW18_08250 [Algoriphagus ratkowskyi]